MKAHHNGSNKEFEYANFEVHGTVEVHVTRPQATFKQRKMEALKGSIVQVCRSGGMQKYMLLAQRQLSSA